MDKSSKNKTINIKHMHLTDIENNLINQLVQHGYNSNKLTPETDLINDLKLSEKDIYNIGWKLNVSYGTMVPMPDHLSNASIKQMAEYFINYKDNAI